MLHEDYIRQIHFRLLLFDSIILTTFFLEYLIFSYTVSCPQNINLIKIHVTGLIIPVFLVFSQYVNNSNYSM